MNEGLEQVSKIQLDKIPVDLARSLVSKIVKKRDEQEPVPVARFGSAI